MYPKLPLPMMLTVSDIKQFVYCRRIVYYRYVVPVPVAPTEQMKAGKDRHVEKSRLERRRTLRKYKLKDGEKLFNHALTSQRLGLTGALDLLIKADDGYYPVEYKYSSGEPELHHRYQLGAYALLVEDAYKCIIRSGFINMLRDEEVFPVDLNESKKLQVKKLLRDIRTMVQEQALPPATPHRERCPNCEFRLYCADTV